MAGCVRFDSANDRAWFTGTIPDPSAGATMTGWARLSVDRDDFSTLARVHASGSTTVTFATDSNGTSGPNYFTGGGSLIGTTGMAVGAWRSWAWTRTGTSGVLYIAPPGGPTEVVSGTVGGAASPTQIAIAGRADGDATEWFNGCETYVRTWAQVLTQAQVEAEWASPVPVIGTNLFADWPLTDAADLTDHSGNGHHLTVGGSAALTTESDGPPVSAPVSAGRFFVFF